MLGLLGWVTGTSALQSVAHGRPAMQPNTSVALILLGISLGLLEQAPVRLARRGIAGALAAIVLAIGAATLVEYATGLDLHVDRPMLQIFPSAGPVPPAGAGIPGRPALPTALGLVLLSLALLLLDVRPRWRVHPAAILAALGASVMHVVVTGHLYDAEMLYQAPHYPATGTALHTAIALGLVAVGVGAARRDRGLMATVTSQLAGGFIARRLLLAAIVGPAVLGFAVEVLAVSDVIPGAPLSYALLATASSAIAALLVMETASRLNETDANRRRYEQELAGAHEAERRLRAQLEEIGTATAAISDALARIPQTEMEAVLQTVVLQARSITGARYAALGVGGDDSHAFERWVYAGLPAEVAAAIGRFPRPVGLLGAVARGGRSIRLDDIGQSSQAVGFPPNHPAMKSFLGVPIRYAGRSIGNLYLADKEGAAAFSEDDQRAAEVLAARAGAALETARLYGEEALAKAWLQGVVDGMPEAVLLADAKGRISYNAAALDLARGDVEGTDAVGTGLRLDVRDTSGHPLGWTELPIVRALQDGATINGQELAIRVGNERVVPVLASAAPLRDRSHATVGAVCVLRDITPLKQLEQLREQWTAVVAHDLRQPVNVIALSIQTLRRLDVGQRDEAAGRAIDRIQSSANRLSRMIGDLLDASRLETKRLVIEPSPTDVAHLLREIVDRTAEVAAPRHVELRIAGELPEAVVDPVRIEQVLDNLLSNAVKYGAPGTDVVVEARVHDGRMIVSVQNEGASLTSDELARLFSRFYRAPSGGGAPGIGLGLYIAKGLVEAHGGRIWAECTGPTATFTFTLPLADATTRIRPTGT